MRKTVLVLLALLFAGLLLSSGCVTAEQCSAGCQEKCGSNWLYGSKFAGYSNSPQGCFCYCKECALTGCHTATVPLQ